MGTGERLSRGLVHAPDSGAARRHAARGLDGRGRARRPESLGQSLQLRPHQL
jgi:hypothetical protein